MTRRAGDDAPRPADAAPAGRQAGRSGPEGDPGTPRSEPADDLEPGTDARPDAGGVKAAAMLVALAAAALAVGFVGGRLLEGLNARELTVAQVAATVSAESAATRTVEALEAPPQGPSGSGAPDTAGLSVGVVEEGRASIGEPAPPFELETPEGETISLADLAGRPVLLNFFATWCVPCRAEMPHLEAVWQQHQDTDLVIVGVDVQETPELVIPWLADVGVTFPAVIDATGQMSLEDYRVGTLPTSVLIDRNGDVATIRRGVFSSEEDVENALQFILPE